MRLICPHCMSGVNVPDDVAGKDATCPNCGKSFPTPARYSAAVVPDPVPPPTPPAPPPVPPPAAAVAPAPHAPAPVPAPPPGLIPPVPPAVDTSGFLAPSSAPAPAPAGYTHSWGITFSPHLFAWLPVALLTVVFVLTFFPWVGCYAGGTAVYSQRPWGAGFSGTPARNYKLEEAKMIPDGWLDKTRSDWKTLVPFFLLLIVALVFAWLERVFRAHPPRALPPLVNAWPQRNVIVAVCAALIFALLLIQWLNGFGMERAIKQHISEQFAAQREKAGSSPAEQERLQYAEEQAFNAYNVEHTTWMYLALACSAVAVLSVLVRVGLDARGNKPPPKLLLHY